MINTNERRIRTFFNLNDIIAFYLAYINYYNKGSIVLDFIIKIKNIQSLNLLILLNLLDLMNFYLLIVY